MVEFLSLTEETAEWIQTLSTEKRFGLQQEIPRLAETPRLKQSIVAAGPLRVAISENGRTLVIWHMDKLGAAGAEQWGFIRISQPLGLFGNSKLINQTQINQAFDSSLLIITQRIQNLMLPAAMIHRSHGDIHTCLSGQGGEARSCSLGYYDGNSIIENSKRRSVLVVGPSTGNRRTIEADLNPFVERVKEYSKLVKSLITESDKVVITSPERPILDIALFKRLSARFKNQVVRSSDTVIAPASRLSNTSTRSSPYVFLDMNYDEWTDSSSPLSIEQRNILETDLLDRQPLRIIGPAGCGKTLLMQLMAMRVLRKAQEKNKECRVMYVVHNSAMRETVESRFEILGASDELLGEVPQSLSVLTLFDFSIEKLESEGEVPILDKDAWETKRFQEATVIDCLQEVIKSNKELLSEKNDYPIFSRLNSSPELREEIAKLITNEIGVVIKGRDLEKNKRGYCYSERPFSMLHANLNNPERDLVFQVFAKYRETVFEGYEQLDADDLALSLLYQLRTPLWGVRRKKLGFDYLFVDETQLFNENERRIFAFLPKRDHGNLPVSIAMDEGQDIQGITSSGFGKLGLLDIENKELHGVHRCTPAILELAFHIIQKTTDLFSLDFPDFTQRSMSLVESKEDDEPQLITCEKGIKIGSKVAIIAAELRKANYRQVGVVVLTNQYWSETLDSIKKQNRNYHVLNRRGEQIDTKNPIVVLGRPETIGGQEFDAVIAVGLENGLIPPLAGGHAGLKSTFEQKALREIYLTFSRARRRLIIVNSYGSLPSDIIQTAIKSKLITI